MTETKWDDEADLVVLGSGAAGLSGALAGAVEGASVVLLEKTGYIGGTTALSGGGYWVAANHHMAKAGVEDSRAEALEYLHACCGVTTDDDILEALVDTGNEMLHFFEEKAGTALPRPWPKVGPTADYRGWLPGGKHGGRTLYPPRFEMADLGEWADRLRIGSPWVFDRLEYYAKSMHLLPPSDGMGGAAPAGPVEAVGNGTALVGDLLKCCLAFGVRPITECPATELVVEDGRVVGVRASRDGQDFAVRARRGVLIATGGFAWNEELKRIWMKRPLVHSCEIVENQGDGHLMGMAIGAQVSNLGDAWWFPQTWMGPLDENGEAQLSGSRDDRSLPHSMIVNARGRRFVDEVTNYYDFGEAFGDKTGATPRNVPAWLVFDRQAAERYMMFGMKVAALSGTRYLHQSDTVEGLAGQIGVDPLALAGEVNRFNGFCRRGVDEDFHRGEGMWDLSWGDPEVRPNPCLGTVEKAPFYAVELFPGALATCGGLQVNVRAQVLSVRGDPIPGLYAAGNCSSGLPIGAYPGAGSTIGAGMTFGYIAGTRMARGEDL
ncbi:MAG TPA: FAD-dependent oxidoreductase [Acidimicrobiales bacterium]|nr:FAD-dependent oxidoreductase [Acidimicrobiales bacterium]